jgi:hypothetical protein
MVTQDNYLNDLILMICDRHYLISIIVFNEKLQWQHRENILSRAAANDDRLFQYFYGFLKLMNGRTSIALTQAKKLIALLEKEYDLSEEK